MTLEERQKEWDEKYDSPNSEPVKSRPARPSKEEDIERMMNDLQKTPWNIANLTDITKEGIDETYSILMEQLESIEKSLADLRNQIETLYPDQPRYYKRIGGNEEHYFEAQYKILTPRNENRKYVIPEKDFIDKELWGREIECQVISWRVSK